VQKYSPFKDWNWDKEIQSQILQAIDMFMVMYANANRKKGSKKIQPPELMQPDYVKKAKKNTKEQTKEDMKAKQKDLAEIFTKRNNQVKSIEELLKDGQNRHLLQ